MTLSYEAVLSQATMHREDLCAALRAGKTQEAINVAREIAKLYAANLDEDESVVVGRLAYMISSVAMDAFFAGRGGAPTTYEEGVTSS